jgi:hypothetical protein
MTSSDAEFARLGFRAAVSGYPLSLVDFSSMILYVMDLGQPEKNRAESRLGFTNCLF